MDGEALLNHCNETELHWLAKRQGLGRLRRGLPLTELIAIVKGEIPVQSHHRSASNEGRYGLALYIHNPEEFPPHPSYVGHWERAMSQLPGCNGLCHKYECTELRFYDCLAPNEDRVR